MWVVGLTGGIGSGKTTVAERFAAAGVPVVDTDAIAHELTAAGGSAMHAIRDAFGDSVLRADGSLDRAAMRGLVFREPAARATLESILHPAIRREVERRLAQLDGPYALLVVPLLVETGGYRDLIDRVLVVDCPESVQVQRAMARSKLAHDEVMAIIAAQASRAERLAAADDVIENVGAPESLRDAVETLHRRYLALAAAASP